MIPPLLLSPLDPSALVDGVARTVDGGFAARLLACGDTGGNTGTLSQDAGQAQEQGGETPMSALVAMLTRVEVPSVPTDGETASADGAGTAEDHAAAPDEGSHAAAAVEPAGTAIVAAAATPAVAPTPEPPATASTNPPSAPAAGQPCPADTVGQPTPAVAAVRSSPTVAVGRPSPTSPAARSEIAPSTPAAGQSSPDVAVAQPSPVITVGRPSPAGPGDRSAAAPTAPSAPVASDAAEPAANAGNGSAAETAVGGAGSRKGAPAGGVPDGSQRPSGATEPPPDRDASSVAPPAAAVERPGMAPVRQSAGPSTGRDGATAEPTPDAETTATASEPTRQVEETARDASTATRPEGERSTAQPAPAFVDPLAGAESDAAAPATHDAPVARGTGETSAPAAPPVARIVELVERLRAEPPPRTIVVDLDQFGVGKLVVSLRGDSVVVEPLDADARLDPHWQEELGAALDERGWSFDADRRSHREPQHSTALASDVPVTGRSTRTRRAADGHLRL